MSLSPMGPSMRAILIPCSGRKVEGGASSAVSHIRTSVSSESWSTLCRARGSLAQQLGLEPGPDLGNSATPSPQLLPAWRRYDGNLYRKAMLTERDMHRPAFRFFVVSALFGVIDARDPIRSYNVAMTDRLPDGRTVHRFWRANGLASIIADLLLHTDPTEVHDFLSGSYRKGVKGLMTELPSGCEYLPRSYPGLGSGSDYHRGNDLRTLLAGA